MDTGKHRRLAGVAYLECVSCTALITITKPHRMDKKIIICAGCGQRQKVREVVGLSDTFYVLLPPVEKPDPKIPPRNAPPSYVERKLQGKTLADED